MDERSLRGHELAIWRGERCLFEGLDFELAPQQLALVLGPNGSGKTSLLRVLAGLTVPTSGKVTWAGIAVESLQPEERADIAYRGHLDALKKDLTIRENLEFHCELWGGATSLDPLLTELSLQSAVDVRARYLSAGQRRRTTLAMLKLSAAKLWILDEPMTNLDREGRTLIVGWIHRHLETGGSAIVATHQPDEFVGPGTLLIEL